MPFSNSFDTKEKNYTFYYDESNNVRTLTLNVDRYNIDNDANQKASINFILAGIAHKSSEPEINFNILIEKLSLQENINEIKFKHIAKGNFEQVLKSNKLTIFLKWLLDSDCYIHYFNLNMEYWSFIDIIDDAFFYARQKSPSSFDLSIHTRHHLDYYKDALYRLIKLEKTKFLSLVKKYNFPKFKPGFECRLIRDINKLLKENLRYSRILSTRIDLQTQTEFKELSKLLSLCSNIPKLVTTYDLNEDLLVSGFDFFYHNRGISFKNSIHKFDIESVVEERFEMLKRRGEANLSNLDYSFIDSEGSIPIQISDIVSGLFNKYFSYIESEKFEDIRKKRSLLNERQLTNLNFLRDLVEKSDSECEQFLFCIMSLSETEKHNILLFDKTKI